MKRFTLDMFIKQSREVHGDRYDYSKTVCGRNKRIPVKIICKKHGEFLQTPQVHTGGSGCPKCALEKSFLTTEEFIRRSRKIFGEKYDYSLVSYKNNRTKVKIICPIHGIFEQEPHGHLMGWGCVKCGNERQTYTTEQFITKAVKIHGNKFDYSKTKYVHSSTRVIITCKEHGDFTQRASAHLEGEGCPKCSRSSGERAIELFLSKTGVKYTTQYINTDCINIRPLKFDFAIFNNDGTLRCLIEYQGIQHFEEVLWGSGRRLTLESQIIRDNIKRDYCEKNNIPLLEVSYKQDLNEFFEEAGGLLWK